MAGCSAPKCTNSDKKGFKMYSFPRDSKRRRIWEARCKRKDWKATNNSKICEVHFVNSDFECRRADGLKKLKPNAVPSLFSHYPHPPAVMKLQKASDLCYKVYGCQREDHCYIREKQNDSSDNSNPENTPGSENSSEEPEPDFIAVGDDQEFLVSSEVQSLQQEFDRFENKEEAEPNELLAYPTDESLDITSDQKSPLNEESNEFFNAIHNALSSSKYDSMVDNLKFMLPRSFELNPESTIVEPTEIPEGVIMLQPNLPLPFTEHITVEPDIIPDNSAIFDNNLWEVDLQYLVQNQLRPTNEVVTVIFQSE